MSELRLDTWEMPAGGTGFDNPLPQLGYVRGPHSKKQVVAKNPLDLDRKYFDYGTVPGCLPYQVRYGYDRVRKPRAFRTAVLENDILRATFLLELGGRLWSLFHKPTHRELLLVNPVFQPCNLGITGIWFSGGVEWNHGIRGHTPYTCEPLFAARVRGDDGTPILRLYEWDRVRRAPYQIDCSLPDGSAFLLVRVRLLNPHDDELPMYWWSNIAVPEADGWRVIAPADRAIKFNYLGELRNIPIPIRDGHDTTYTTSSGSAGDYFYYLEDGQRPWIAVLDPDGRGLVQASTARLKGRKLFSWGMGPGGRRWHEFLSPGGPPYVEIQAGLARTQAECLPMPPKSEWAWLEAYGLMEADPAAVHGDDWGGAVREVEERLGAAIPAAEFEAQFAATAPAADREPEDLLHAGSGWGALERRRRERAGEPPFCSGAIRFDDATLGPRQAPWLALLEDGALPSGDPADFPVAYMVQAEWRQLLEGAAAAGRGAHWLSWLHLGIMAYYAGEADTAKQAWETSLDLAESAWARRNLAVLAMHQKRLDDAADLYLRARELAPELEPLAIECFRVLIRAEHYQDAADLVARLPAHVWAISRIKMLAAKASLELDDLDTVRRLLETDLVVTDMREGEVSLSDLWYRMHEKQLAAAENIPIDDALHERVRREFPPPAHIDFRMHARRRPAGKGKA